MSLQSHWTRPRRYIASAKKLYGTFRNTQGTFLPLFTSKCTVPMSKCEFTITDLDLTHAVEAAAHLGLLSMQERASLIGAVFKCISRQGEGTTIEVRLVT